VDTWRSAIAASTEEGLWIHGYDIRMLMQQTSFAGMVFLLHRGRLPNPGEQQLLDAILVAVADHGAGAPSCATARLVASGNRQSLSAAVAAGILAIGDEHGGAGSACMEMIGAGIELASTQSISLQDAASHIVDETKAQQKRVPGLGHRVHTKKDPRVEVLFSMSREHGVTGKGIAFMQSLEAAAGEKIKQLPINIDGALAAVLFDLGFSANAGKLMFIIGRVAGLTAEVAEEYSREKPMRIRIPVQYDGVPPRSMERSEKAPHNGHKE
jgi:citrate synthase